MVYHEAMAHSRSARRGGKTDPNGLYVTPPVGTQALLKQEIFTGPIWEPACGNGAIATVLAAEGRHQVTGRKLRVISTDLADHGFGTAGVDFLQETRLRAPTIVTNPPFPLAEKFVLHALQLGAKKVCLLLRLAFLEGEGRLARIYDRTPPARVHVFSWRLAISPGEDLAYYAQQNGRGGVTPYAWFVWEKLGGSYDSPGGTIIHWI